MKARPILSLTLATAQRTSVGVLATNEAKSHRLGLVKLTVGGFSESVTQSRAQTHNKRFDVSPASALHNFVVASPRSASKEFIADFEKRAVVGLVERRTENLSKLASGKT